MYRLLHTNNKRKAFTLIEILGVVAVIAVLVVVAILGFGLGRCTILKSAADRELQTLNSAYSHFTGVGGSIPVGATVEEALEAMSVPINGMGPFIRHPGNALMVFNNVCNGPVPLEYNPEGFSTPPPNITPTPDPDVTPDPNITPDPDVTPTPEESDDPIEATLLITPGEIPSMGEAVVTFAVINPNDPINASIQIPAPMGLSWVSGNVVGGQLTWSGTLEDTVEISGTLVGETHGTYSITGTVTPSSGDSASSSASLVVLPPDLTVGANNLTGNFWMDVTVNIPGHMYPDPPTLPRRTALMNGYHYSWRVRQFGWGVSMQVWNSPQMTGGGNGFSVFGPIDFAWVDGHSSLPPYSEMSRPIVVRLFFPSTTTSGVVTIPIVVESRVYGASTFANQPEFIPPGATFHVPSGGYATMNFAERNTVVHGVTVAFNRAGAAGGTVGASSGINTWHQVNGSFAYQTSQGNYRFQGRRLPSRTYTIPN